MVLALGVTVTLPDVATVPMPLSMDTAEALVVDQVKVAVCPALMLAGLAEKLMVGGGVLLPTVTVARAVEVPPGPVAVKV